MNESNKRLCVSCFWRMDGVCYFKKRHVEDSETCLQFTPRQDAPEPMPAAPLPMPAPLPPAPPVESPPEPEAVKPVALIVSDPPRPVWHRQPFNFTAWLKQIFGVNRLGALSMSNNFPHPNGRGEVKNNITNERNTK